jgi:hypothetical protein
MSVAGDIPESAEYIQKSGIFSSIALYEAINNGIDDIDQNNLPDKIEMQKSADNPPEYGMGV